MRLSSAMKRASAKVWDALTPASRPDYKIFTIREEGLTSLALTALSSSNCKNIKTIEMISAKDENLFGYDFQLSIGSDEKRKWINFYIQAKKLSGNQVESNYTTITKKQITDLIAYSRWKGVPTFALYNNLQENRTTLKHHYNSTTTFKNENLGITLVSAHALKTRKDFKFSTLHNSSGVKLPRKIYSPNSLINVFNYYKNQTNIAVPFHELAYLTTDLAEKINSAARTHNRAGKLGFFFFFIPGFDDFLFNDNDNLIPILNTTSDEIVETFNRNRDTSNVEGFNPKALLVIEEKQI